MSKFKKRVIGLTGPNYRRLRFFFLTVNRRRLWEIVSIIGQPYFCHAHFIPRNLHLSIRQSNSNKNVSLGFSVAQLLYIQGRCVRPYVTPKVLQFNVYIKCLQRFRSFSIIRVGPSVCNGQLFCYFRHAIIVPSISKFIFL